LNRRKNTIFRTFNILHQLRENATDAIVISNTHHRHPCRAHLRWQAQIVPQASSILLEFPATPLPESRKNAHSHLSN